MAEYGELQTGQIELLHQQTHDQTGEAGNCDDLRQQHDSLAAELVKRGVVHDTEMVCPESELGRAAPNYRRGFTDDVCEHCAFGQLFSYCNLYKEDYTGGYTCDSFRYYEVLELEPPHGFLMASGKQTALATIDDLNSKKAQLVISNGEAFGIAEFEAEPVQLKTKEFEAEEWLAQHRITPRERRQWWPEAETFYVYRLKTWHPYEGIKLYEGGKVINEPRLTAGQWQIVSRAKELPKQIILLDDAVSVSEKQEFVINLSEKCKELDSILSATYQTDVKEAKSARELIPIYSLALVRNPRMRVSKKNLTAEDGKVGISSDGATGQMDIKQEGEDMPYRIRKRGDEYCVVKVNADDTDGESAGCHRTEEEAEAQLAALRINVEAEEGESAHHTDKPRKRKPRKKEIADDTTFFDRLKLAAKNIIDLVILAETEKEKNKTEWFVNKVGIAQKMVNGELWHFTYSTNAFEDREGEIFSTKSLERYVVAAKEKGDKGYFNLWHIAGTDFARKEWQEVIGRFLVEAGPYLDNKQGRAAAEFFKEYGEGHPEIAPEGWGCSPEFRYLPEERATGVYENIWITRTSTLPKLAAANIWTETRQLARKDMSYSEEQIKTAIEVFKDKEFVKTLFAEGETKTAELEAANVAHKKKDEPEAEEQPVPQEIQLNMEELAAEVGKQFQADLTPIGEAIVTMANDLKEMRERLEKVEEIKRIEDKTETPRFIFNMKRASEAEETTVTDDDGLKTRQPTETRAATNDPWAQTFNK